MKPVATPKSDTDDTHQQHLFRREQLSTEEGPETKTDYSVTLKGDMDANSAHVCFHYVPDKYVLNPISLEHYLMALDQTDWQNLETLALAILDDINNEVVPRWVQILIQSTNNKSGNGHRVLVQDRQPNWDNAPLLDRLR